MAVFKARDPNVEVLGANIFSVIEGMGVFKMTALEILESCGIKDLDPQKWYNSQNWLDAFKIIYERLGDATLKFIGTKIPEVTKLPPQINSIEAFLPMLDMAFYMNHKGGDIGHYKFEETGNKEGFLTVDNPYPCAFDHGLIQGFLEKFREPNSIPSVKHEPGNCIMNGDSACKYHLRW